MLLVAALAVELWVLFGPKGKRTGPEVEVSPSTATLAPPTPEPSQVIVDDGSISVTTTTTTLAPEETTTPPPIAPVTPPPVAPSAPTATRTPAPVAPPPTTLPRAATPPPNPVPGLLAQADQARTAGRWAEAIRAYDEVLKVEPENPEAKQGKLRAAGERASVNRYFLTAVTMSEGKGSGGGIEGFGGANLVKSRCDCAITYEVAPPNPVQEQPYSVSIYLKNDSKKDIKPKGLTVNVTINGKTSRRDVALMTREVPRGQRTLVGKLEDKWALGTTSWALEAAVSADNTYRAQLTWELKLQ
jgi:hypothetical protein